MTKRAKAYSYLRFSTAEQKHGDSDNRQTRLAEQYAARQGLDLDTRLTFKDKGVSGYRGQNAVEGALSRFIAAVDEGAIKPGSYLLVENLDRLSRDKVMAALNRFAALLEKKIKIVTLTDGKVYDDNSLNNLPDLMMSLLVMSRAHEESEMKSMRIRHAWQAKRDRAGDKPFVLTARAPAWLRVKEGKFDVLPERAAIVRRMFDLTLAGTGKAVKIRIVVWYAPFRVWMIFTLKPIWLRRYRRPISIKSLHVSPVDYR